MQDSVAKVLEFGGFLGSSSVICYLLKKLADDMRLLRFVGKASPLSPG